MDKVQKIRAEIERLKKENNDEYDSYDQVRLALLEELGEFIDSMQKEPVNNGLDLGCGVIWQDEDLEEAISEYCSNPDNFISYVDVGFAYMSEQKDDIPLIIKAIEFGAQWRKEQMMAKAVDAEILAVTDNDSSLCAHTHLELFVEPSDLERMALKDNDKVKVIVIKEG